MSENIPTVLLEAEDILTSWQEPLRAAYESGHQILLRPEKKGEDQDWCTLVADPVRQAPADAGNGYSTDEPMKPPPFRRALGHLVRIKAVVVGLDFREYSRREPEAQLLLSIALEASIDKTIRALRRGQLLPQREPRLIESTGDGSYLVFTLLDEYRPLLARHWKPPIRTANEAELSDEGREWLREKHRVDHAGFATLVDRAMSFVFGLNAVLTSDNAREAFRPENSNRSASASAHPVECRFAVSYDDLLLRRGLTEPRKLHCSGTGIVTCSRILSRDHANHLLVHDALLRKLEGRGGLPSICRGIWQHRLHGALLGETQVKSTTYRFADLFGFYTDAPLLRSLGRLHESPHQCHIGSHDLGSVDGV